MNRKHLKYILAFLAFCFWTWLSFIAGKIMLSIDTSMADVEHASYKLENLVTISRSPDWKYGKGFYTVVVIATPENETSYNVVCKVHVGNANYFEYIELGQANSIAEALDKWEDIEWTDESLIIGKDGPNQKVVSRKQIETHR
jgi:hypothetical protein